jgi:hypothetical protein
VTGVACTQMSSSADSASAYTRSGRLHAPRRLHVLMLHDFDRADAIGTFWAHPQTPQLGELLIDLEEDRAARAVVFGLLAEMEAKQPHCT